MNLNAGVIMVQLVEVDGVTIARASVMILGNEQARFEVPLAPELRDVRDDVANVASRAADTMVALVRDLKPDANDIAPMTDADKQVAMDKLFQTGVTVLANSHAAPTATVTMTGHTIRVPVAPAPNASWLNTDVVVFENGSVRLRYESVVDNWTDPYAHALGRVVRIISSDQLQHSGVVDIIVLGLFSPRRELSDTGVAVPGQ